MPDGIKTIKARYRCTGCNHEWDWEQGASSGHLEDGTMVHEYPVPDGCPSCYGRYFEWLDPPAGGK